MLEGLDTRSKLWGQAMGWTIGNELDWAFALQWVFALAALACLTTMGLIVLALLEDWNNGGRNDSP